MMSYGHMKVHEEINEQEHHLSKQMQNSYTSLRRMGLAKKGKEFVLDRDFSPNHEIVSSMLYNLEKSH